jgi:NAD(P)H-dependent FMN reductase
MTTRIGIIIASTRPGRVGESISRWVHDHAGRRTDAHFELVDLADYALPSTGHADPGTDLARWARTIEGLDGFVVVTPEYNHSFPADLKRALDALTSEWANKAVGFVSYGGSAAGARAVEQLRLVFAELEVASVRANVTLPFASEFTDNYTTFAPGEYQLQFLDKLLDQLTAWSGVMAPLRSPAELVGAGMPR